ncbi:hypothetical protein FRACA_4470001 [Frankia canadensis]|uniref:Uncharacterized protein n=1 Tax=Frankia canadensis TaxID=1836972 RepID=A0A2I2KXG9_9ACTN|nr:hypothetical protein FRACA_4470001 [Frankia canadensis]SOU57655.1 hypothetical protein FRACA_4470001 [Frankia canadensis]
MVDRDRAVWLENGGDADILRYGAYYVSLAGETPTSNKNKQVVRVPRANRLTPSSLRTLCEDDARLQLRRYGVNG